MTWKLRGHYPLRDYSFGRYGLWRGPLIPGEGDVVSGVYFQWDRSRSLGLCIVPQPVATGWLHSGARICPVPHILTPFDGPNQLSGRGCGLARPLVYSAPSVVILLSCRAGCCSILQRAHTDREELQTLQNARSGQGHRPVLLVDGVTGVLPLGPHLSTAAPVHYLEPCSHGPWRLHWVSRPLMNSSILSGSNQIPVRRLVERTRARTGNAGGRIIETINTLALASIHAIRGLHGLF